MRGMPRYVMPSSLLLRVSGISLHACSPKLLISAQQSLGHVYFIEYAKHETVVFLGMFCLRPYSLELLISTRKEEICLFSNLLLLNSFLDQHRHKIVASAIYFIEYVKHETVVFFHETGGTRLFKMVYYVLPRQSQLVNGADLF
jgi:hypothetical protein